MTKYGENDPTKEELRHLFIYDAELGRLRWKNSRSTRIKNGDLAGTIDRKPKCNRRIIRINGKRHPHARLVYIFHNGDIPEGKFVDHIDENTLNDHKENLELLSNGDNQRRSHDWAGEYHSTPSNPAKCNAIRANTALSSAGWYPSGPAGRSSAIPTGSICSDSRRAL